MKMDWPGNVRQLRNFVHRVAVFAEHDPVTKEDIEAHGAEDESARDSEQPRLSGLETAEFLRGVWPTQSRRENALRLAQNQVRILEARGHAAEAICQIMGIGRTTLFRIKTGAE
jgi:DNA-binding NtrC family response regulator